MVQVVNDPVELANGLRPILLRRTRDHVRLEVPERTTEIVRIPPTDEQKALHDAHPKLQSFTCVVDRHLNDHGYIVPGLGDAGDRLFGRGAGRVPQTVPADRLR